MNRQTKRRDVHLPSFLLLLVLTIIALTATGCAATPAATRVSGSGSSPAMSGSSASTRKVLAHGMAGSKKIAVFEDTNGGRTTRGIQLERDTLRRTALDPMADVVMRLVTEPRHVLVVGVGTGQLSTDLARQGVDVTVLESDPMLARTICSFAGCGGTVAVHPSPWYVIGGHESVPAVPHLGPSSAASAVEYDAVIIDEEISYYPLGPALAHDLKGVKLAPGALVADRRRWNTAPPRSEADTEPPLLLVGEREDGTWDEIRITSNAVDLDPRPEVADLHVWPPQQTLEILPGQSGATKEVRVFGYLVQREDGALAVELPHDREGVVVVMLTGEVAARELEPKASRGVVLQDWGTAKGETVPIMAPLVGVGHRLRHGRSVVASDVVVALRGNARFLGRGRAPDNRPGRGGAYYTLDVSSAERVIDQPAWAPAEARHVARLDAARVKITAGDYSGAASELEAATSELRAWLGHDADHCQWVHATENFAAALRDIDKHGLLGSCMWLTRFSPRRPTTMRPVAHPADARMYGALKKSTDGIFLRLAKRKDTSEETETAAACWWRSTFHDPGFPNAMHHEINRRFPGVAQPILD